MYLFFLPFKLTFCITCIATLRMSVTKMILSSIFPFILFFPRVTGTSNFVSGSQNFIVSVSFPLSTHPRGRFFPFESNSLKLFNGAQPVY